MENPGPRETAVLDSILARMLESPAAQRLAGELIRERTAVRVRFEHLAGASGMLDWDDEGSLRVNLDESYLRDDSPETRRNAIATLAHELLGHALWRIRAVKAGVGPAFEHYENDEANAHLVEWTIAAELGEALDDPYMRDFLEDPRAYHRRMKSRTEVSAVTFSLAEMDDPLAALRGRLSLIQTAMREPGLDAARRENIRQIGGKIQERISHYSTGQGLADIYDLRRSSRDGFFKKFEEDLAKRSARLSALAREKPR